MKKDLPIWIMEPEQIQKRAAIAQKMLETKQKAPVVPETDAVDEIKQHLREIRKHTRDNIAALVEELKANLIQQHPQIKLKSALDNTEAIDYISEISDGIKLISTNNSAIITEELKPGLVASGFTVVNSYLDEFDVKEKKLIEYWQLPYLLDKNLGGIFDTAIRMDSLPEDQVKGYLAVLGVNTISASNPTVFFLQHFHNIQEDLRQAKKVILVVGLDRIIRNIEDAAFHAKCMGLFGLEAILLGIQPKPGPAPTVAELPFLTEDKSRELHLIILDNNRTSLLDSEFKDFLLCIGCRRCNGNCPATISGKPLRPREIVLNLKKQLFEVGSELLKEESEAKAPPTEKDLAGRLITQDEIWACTTCSACQESCPVEIKHLEAINGLRQNLVMDQAVIPETAEGALRSIEARGHPWRGTRFSRTDWAEGLGIKTLAEDSDVDLLYWVGCSEALEDRSIKVAQATAKLLTLAGLKIGILGAEESCCGEPARRLGNEYLFMMQAEKNIGVLKGYGVKKIVTACPHGYHTLKNEYPKFGGEFEVIHHTELISHLLKEGKIKVPASNSGIVTYHDACYLGRHNGIYEPPREILSNMPGVTLVEMEQNRSKGFCCGGGGGRMWLEERIGRRICELRTERAIETKAQTVVTACPFCLQMFEDAIKAKGVEESLKVMDIAELVSHALMK